MCPVCGFNRLPRPAAEFLICSCCGTEFENDDFEKSHEELRAQWLRDGTQWFSRATHPPAGWSAYEQLKSAGFISRYSSNVAVSAMSTEQRQPALRLDSPVRFVWA